MFDSHAHYDDRRFDKDRDELFPFMFENGVEGIVNIGCDLETSLKSIAIAEKYQNVYATAGVHPHEAKDVPEDWLVLLESMLSHPKVVALGEIGLDYHYDFSPRDIQKVIFEKQMQLAQRLGKPIVIHNREAHADTLEMLFKYPEVKAVLHSFSGSYETAEILVKKGYYISFSGTVTYDTAENIRRSVKAVPIDRVLCETDAPYLTPVPLRKKRNDSYTMRYTVEALADIYGLDFQTMSDICRDNAYRFFGINKA